MNRKAQVLILSLWILAILSVLAVGIGHRVSMSLRLTRYNRDKIKALYLANAGLKLAIAELEKDTNDYDALLESWADNEEVFKRIVLDDEQAEFATVSYVTTDENNSPKTIYGVADEERKLNINTASKDLLLSLFEECAIEDFPGKVNNLLIWLGAMPDEDKIYENLGYLCKAAKLSNIEELKLVKDITEQDYKKLKDLITVYGDKEGKININTVSIKALNIFTYGIGRALSPPVDKNFAYSVASKITALRNTKGFFTNSNDINIELTGEEEMNIFEQLKNKIIFKSENFLIEVTGNAGTIKSKIYSVYSGQDAKNILYWHER